MISRRTCSVPTEYVVCPRLLYSDSRCSQACRMHSQVLPWLSPDLLCPCRDVGRSSQVHLKATASVQSTLGFDHPGILVRQLPNTPWGSQTLPEAPSDKHTFCWCQDAELTCRKSTKTFRIAPIHKQFWNGKTDYFADWCKRRRITRHSEHVGRFRDSQAGQLLLSKQFKCHTEQQHIRLVALRLSLPYETKGALPRGANHKIFQLCDPKNTKFLQTSEVFSSGEATWAEILFSNNYIIENNEHQKNPDNGPLWWCVYYFGYKRMMVRLQVTLAATTFTK